MMQPPERGGRDEKAKVEPIIGNAERNPPGEYYERRPILIQGKFVIYGEEEIF